jgi:hypothetical protein
MKKNVADGITGLGAELLAEVGYDVQNKVIDKLCESNEGKTIKLNIVFNFGISSTSFEIK